MSTSYPDPPSFSFVRECGEARFFLMSLGHASLLPRPRLLRSPTHSVVLISVFRMTLVLLFYLFLFTPIVVLVSPPSISSRNYSCRHQWCSTPVKLECLFRFPLLFGFQKKRYGHPAAILPDTLDSSSPLIRADQDLRPPAPSNAPGGSISCGMSKKWISPKPLPFVVDYVQLAGRGND